MKKTLLIGLLMAMLGSGCARRNPVESRQQAVLLQLDSNTDSLRELLLQARQEGKKWKTDRWREVFARFDEAEAPIHEQLNILSTAAEKPPYHPEEIKTWLDQLAERRMEIARVKNELTEVARKTKNGKAVIAGPATTEPTKAATHK